MITSTDQSAKTAPAQPCRFLRTKKMYIPGLADTALIEDHHDQSFYWCNKTQSALGRDDYPVRPCSCQPGRACHEA
jgi:hypothetical protein